MPPLHVSMDLCSRRAACPAHGKGLLGTFIPTLCSDRNLYSRRHHHRSTAQPLPARAVAPTPGLAATTGWPRWRPTSPSLAAPSTGSSKKGICPPPASRIVCEFPLRPWRPMKPPSWRLRPADSVPQMPAVLDATRLHRPYCPPTPSQPASRTCGGAGRDACTDPRRASPRRTFT